MSRQVAEGRRRRVAENASVVEARQLADDLVERPDELDQIVPLLPWRHLEAGSADALVMVDKYRPAMNAFGRVFSTALIPYCANYQRTVLRLFPKVLKSELRETTTLQEASSRQIAAAQRRTLYWVGRNTVDRFAPQAESSQKWGPLWRRWRDLMDMEVGLDPGVVHDVETADVLKIGFRSASSLSTQVMQMLGDYVRNPEQAKRITFENANGVDLIKSAEKNVWLLDVLASRQDERQESFHSYFTGASARRLRHEYHPFRFDRVPLVHQGDVLAVQFNVERLTGPNGCLDDVPIRNRKTLCVALRPTKFMPILDGDATGPPPEQTTIDIVHGANIKLSGYGVWHDLTPHEPAHLLALP